MQEIIGVLDDQARINAGFGRGVTIYDSIQPERMRKAVTRGFKAVIKRIDTAGVFEITAMVGQCPIPQGRLKITGQTAMPLP